MTKPWRNKQGYITTCPACFHEADGCDEDCVCCGECYMKTGKEICSKTCEHAEHLDDGGFLIDGNHPDDMFCTKKEK